MTVDSCECGCPLKAANKADRERIIACACRCHVPHKVITGQLTSMPDIEADD